MAEPSRSSNGHLRVLLGLASGAIAGIGANALALRLPGAARVIGVLADAVAHPIGQLFLRLLFLVVVPLVFASLACGVARLGDPRRLGTIGLRTLALFLLTTAFSVVLGLGVMRAFAPGVGFDEEVRSGLMRSFGGEAAKMMEKAPHLASEGLLAAVNQILDMLLPRNVLDAVVRMQMLPLILFALIFGCALTSVEGERRERFLTVLDTVSDAMVWIVALAMRFAPAAVFCLIFAVTARFGAQVLARLALFVVLVLACYLVQLLAFYPVVLRFLARRRPYEFLGRALPVIVTAFSTSSSNATLPTTLRVAQKELGIRPSIAGFVLPLGATINMNGTALFEGAVVLFVGQVFGVELSLVDQLVVVLLCVVSAIGAAGVPGGSLPLLMVVMSQVGVPPEGIALVIGVDRLLDMGRTVINVTGDLVTAACVETSEARRDAMGAGAPPA
jgi:DAACS family dicarboxylate/amino acid:cation (Na+ or H+) symporter